MATIVTPCSRTENGATVVDHPISSSEGRRLDSCKEALGFFRVSPSQPKIEKVISSFHQQRSFQLTSRSSAQRTVGLIWGQSQRHSGDGCPHFNPIMLYNNLFSSTVENATGANICHLFCNKNRIHRKGKGHARKLRVLSFCQNWPARPITLQRKCNHLKEHLHDIPSYSSGGVDMILEVC